MAYTKKKDCLALSFWLTATTLITDDVFVDGWHEETISLHS